MSLMSLYVATTIFGVSVTVMDFIGLLGGSHDSDAHDGHGDYGDHDSAGGDAGDHYAPGDDGHHALGDDHITVLSQDRNRGRMPFLRLLTILRSLVYFSLGFGPVGWFAMGSGYSALAALLWAVPSGTVALCGVFFIRRLQRQELDSQIKPAELLFQRGKVLIPIMPGQIGKVRVFLETQEAGIYADRFAKASDNQTAISKGSRIRVVQIDQDYLYVETEGKREPSGADKEVS